jgi:uncharacterized membrane protein HdeD (DUF308 family)
MGCVTRIFSVLIGIVIIFAGFLVASCEFLGSCSPEFGIPIMLIGAALFLFVVVVGILGTKWPTAMETFVITIGVILLAIGVERIKVEVTARGLSAWPILICTAGAFVLLCHRRIAGWVHNAGRFFKPRSSNK